MKKEYLYIGIGVFVIIVVIALIILLSKPKKKVKSFSTETNVKNLSGKSINLKISANDSTAVNDYFITSGNNTNIYFNQLKDNNGNIITSDNLNNLNFDTDGETELDISLGKLQMYYKPSTEDNITYYSDENGRLFKINTSDDGYIEVMSDNPYTKDNLKINPGTTTIYLQETDPGYIGIDIDLMNSALCNAEGKSSSYITYDSESNECSCSGKYISDNNLCSYDQCEHEGLVCEKDTNEDLEYCKCSIPLNDDKFYPYRKCNSDKKTWNGDDVDYSCKDKLNPYGTEIVLPGDTDISCKDDAYITINDKYNNKLVEKDELDNIFSCAYPCSSENKHIDGASIEGNTCIKCPIFKPDNVNYVDIDLKDKDKSAYVLKGGKCKIVKFNNNLCKNSDIYRVYFNDDGNYNGYTCNIPKSKLIDENGDFNKVIGYNDQIKYFLPSFL